MQKTRSTVARPKGSAPAKGKKAAPAEMVSSRIRAIGNSRGVILSNQLIDRAGISPDADIVISAFKGMITIIEAKKTSQVNTDLSTWDEAFKKANRAGKKPEGDLWEGIGNTFDAEEWT